MTKEQLNSIAYYLKGTNIIRTKIKGFVIDRCGEGTGLEIFIEDNENKDELILKKESEIYYCPEDIIKEIRKSIK